MAKSATLLLLLLIYPYAPVVTQSSSLEHSEPKTEIDYTRIRKSTVHISLVVTPRNRSLGAKTYQSILERLSFKDKEPVILQSGSGFFINGNGFVLTSEHLLKKPSTGRYRSLFNKKQREFVYFNHLYNNWQPSIIVEVNRGDYDSKSLAFPAHMVARDTTRDISLLWVNHKPSHHLEIEQNLQMSAEAKRYFTGVPVIAAGFPRGLSFKATDGKIRGREVFLDQEYLDFDITVDKGSSGGPLIDMRSGKVFGIVSAIKDRSFNLAVPWWNFGEKIHMASANACIYVMGWLHYSIDMALVKDGQTLGSNGQYIFTRLRKISHRKLYRQDKFDNMQSEGVIGITGFFFKDLAAAKYRLLKVREIRSAGDQPLKVRVKRHIIQRYSDIQVRPGYFLMGVLRQDKLVHRYFPYGTNFDVAREFIWREVN